jgi:hypothetical protein
MNLAAKILLDGCAQLEETNEQVEEDFEEESLKPSSETSMVL